MCALVNTVSQSALVSTVTQCALVSTVSQCALVSTVSQSALVSTVTFSSSSLFSALTSWYRPVTSSNLPSEGGISEGRALVRGGH